MEPHSLVSRALQTIPEGDLDQQTFRDRAQIALMNRLGSHPQHPDRTIVQIVDDAGEHARKETPGFLPKYDREALELIDDELAGA